MSDDGSDVGYVSGSRAKGQVTKGSAALSDIHRASSWTTRVPADEQPLPTTSFRADDQDDSPRNPLSRLGSQHLPSGPEASSSAARLLDNPSTAIEHSPSWTASLAGHTSGPVCTPLPTPGLHLQRSLSQHSSYSSPRGNNDMLDIEHGRRVAHFASNATLLGKTPCSTHEWSQGQEQASASNTPCDGFPAAARTLTAQDEASMATSFHSGIRQAGWLFKMVKRNQETDTNWKKYWFYLVDDRLYYSLNASTATEQEAGIGGKIRYITLDRIPVRPLPHRHKRCDAGRLTQPDIGVSVVPPRTLQSKGIKLAPGTVFGLVAGSHTYFLAADTPQDARTWVKVLREQWVHCFKHPLRSASLKDLSGVHEMSLMLAENTNLRKSLKDHTMLAMGVDSQYWTKWLEEKSLNRLLEQKFTSDVEYEVEIKTGRMKGAASDARVYIEMFAAHSEASTGKLRCANVDLPQKAFQRNGLDLFEFKTTNVGMPGHLKVWHDNTGRLPDWFLEYIRVRKKGLTNKGLWTMFPCQRWLSTQLDDCRISRVLFAGHASPLIMYRVQCVTSDLRGAGTDANVHLIMHGVLGDGDRHVLSNSADDFDRGITNDFTVLDEELGELLEVTVGHDGTGHGASWHLDHLAITNTKTEQTYWFLCRQWFDTHVGDGAIERTLPVSNGIERMVLYTILITTSDLRGAGTDADVHMSLHGDVAGTSTVILPSRPEHFERGQTDTFRLELPHVGKIRTLTIGHNNMGRGPSWHLDMVQIVDEDKGDVYYFACGKWLALDQEDGLIERTLAALSSDPSAKSTEYKIEFHTSRERGAGTDANVFFQLHGTTASSAVHKLQAPKEAFERGSVDTFKYRMRFMGALQRMVIQHDNSGDNPAWHLLKVVVRCAKDSSVTVFACNQWLQSADSSVYPSVELFAGGTLPDMLQYKLVAVTSDLRGAGTDSKVTVELFGTGGTVGPVKLDSDGAFERGKADTFIFEGADIGSITKLLVTSDGQGIRSAWHLDHMALWRDPNHDSLESASYFRCGVWFNQDHGLTKVLLPERHPGHELKSSFTIRVFTSDIKGAGTDAGVEINFVGDLGETGFVRLLANHDILERGQEDVFDDLLHDIGRPHYCIVRSDGRTRRPTWHLDKIILDSHARLPPTFFIGELWLGPATVLEAKISASFTDPCGDKAKYLVTVITSDTKHAGTDMGVVVEVLGDHGSSGRQPLIDLSKDTFERAQTDEFYFTCRQLGHLSLLRVTVDRKGTPWHLKMVVVQSQEGQKYYFPYNNWLGVQNPAVEIHAVMVDPSENFKSYCLATYTSAVQGASTDANVYIELRGASGSSGKTMLRNMETSNFEPGQTDEFVVGPVEDLGPLTELVVGHDNAGIHPAWRLDAVKVTDLKTGVAYWFACDEWLATTQGDGSIERCLSPCAGDPRRPKASYTVKVKTSDLPGAGTSSNVYVDILGSLASTGKKFLTGSKNPKPFERAVTDMFTIATVPLGQLQQLLVGHDATGPDPKWHLDCVEVSENKTGQTWWFECHRWLDTASGDAQIQRILQASNQNPCTRKAEALIKVKTSNKRGAGTDANVFIVLYGQDGGSSGKLTLDSPANNFEAGMVDEFKLLVKDVFPLKKILVGHDNSGLGPAWHLEYVEVTNLRVGESTMFPCNKWLSRSDGDMQIERELYPLGTDHVESTEYEVTVVTSDISGAGTDANVFVQMFGEDNDSGPLQLDDAKNNFERGDEDVFVVKTVNVGELEKIRIWTDNKGLGSSWHCEIVIITNKTMNKTWYCYCGQWLSKEEGLEKTLIASPTDPRNSLSTYVVTTHTSDISGAGTDANVFIDLKGDRGASGPRALEGHGNNFEQGKADKFVLKLMDLGELASLDVWHDNSGLGPGWHLDYIEVHSSATNKVYYFPCSQWFDKREGDGIIHRTLIGTTKDPRTFKARYRVSTRTSDIFGAGTDANVFINIFGADGETGKVGLDNPLRNDFERGQIDIFEFESRNVGAMCKICIGHDGKGVGAGWHLAMVEVENLATGERITFECNRWFDVKEDDGAIERDLFPNTTSNEPQEHWKLTIVTGDESGAGTDAEVYISLVGTEARFGPHTLTANSAAFERGRHDEFSLSTPLMGTIEEMTLGHNGRGFGAAWLLDSATLENKGTGERYFFHFCTWLDTKHGMFRSARPAKHLAAKAKGLPCDYRVELTPGNGPDGNLFDGSVYLDIRGQDGQTGRQTIETPAEGFVAGVFQAYELCSLLDVGMIGELEVGHGGTAPWALEKIVVINLTNGHRAMFLANKALLPGTMILLQATAPSPVDYKVEVQTGHVAGAGTSAKVAITIFGFEGTTGQYDLVPAKAGFNIVFYFKNDLPPHWSAGHRFCRDICEPSPFQRGLLDTFHLSQLPDVGALLQIEIGHDNSGVGPGWHLGWVQVTNLTSGQVARFECDRWLAKDKDDGQIKRLLDVSNALDIQQVQQQHALGRLAAGGPQVLMDPYAPLDPCLLAAIGGPLLAKFGNATGAPGYKVTFTTGNAICAGTGAQVFFEIVGQNGSSGTIMTQPGSSQFSRGANDTFVFPRLPYLGHLLQMRVGTKGDGMFATWSLRTAEVVHIATGCRYIFNCHAWIDKKSNWQRVLPLTKAL